MQLAAQRRLRAHPRKQRLLFVGVVPRAAVLKVPERRCNGIAFFRRQRAAASPLGHHAQDAQKVLNAPVTILQHADRVIEARIRFSSNLNCHASTSSVPYQHKQLFLSTQGGTRMIRIKRTYDAPAAGDGARFLVDRLWPRGIAKEALPIDAWLKDAAPSNELRGWYHHEPAQWDEFRHRYFAELRANPAAWQPLAEAARRGPVTLLYSSKNVEHNNAEALKEFLDKHLHQR